MEVNLIKNDARNEASVDYIVFNGNTGSDEDIDALVDIIRHSLRTQFGCRVVMVTIQQTLDVQEDNNGQIYT